MQQAAIIILALIAIASACGVVFSRQAVHSALCLTGNLLSIALIYLLMSLQFLAAAQMVIYAGAIMVVFLFAVTLLAPTEELNLKLGDGTRMFGLVTGAFVMAGLLVTVYTSGLTLAPAISPPSRLAEFATQLFGLYVLPFECTAFVLLVALIGAVLLGHRRLTARDSQQEVRHD